MLEQSRLDELAKEIHILNRTTVEHLVDIGDRLIEARKILKPDGKWNDWLEREFDWSTRTAYNFISVAQAAEKYPQLLDFRSKSVLYLIAGSSDPEGLIEKLQDEGKIGYNEARHIADAHKWRKEVEELISSDPGAAFYEIDQAMSNPTLREPAVELLTRNKTMFGILSARDPDELLAEAGISFDERHPRAPVSKTMAKLYEDANNGKLVVWTGGDISEAHTIAIFPKVPDPEAMAWRSTCIRACVDATNAKTM